MDIIQGFARRERARFHDRNQTPEQKNAACVFAHWKSALVEALASVPSVYGSAEAAADRVCGPGAAHKWYPMFPKDLGVLRDQMEYDPGCLHPEQLKWFEAATAGGLAPFFVVAADDSYHLCATDPNDLSEPPVVLGPERSQVARWRRELAAKETA
jgi:hypothetical protein